LSKTFVLWCKEILFPHKHTHRFHKQ